MLKHLLHRLHNPWVTLIVIVAAVFFGYSFPNVAVNLVGLPHLYEALLTATVIPFVVSAMLVSVERLSSVGGMMSLTFRVFAIVGVVVVLFALLGVALAAWAGLGADLPRDSLEGLARVLLSSGGDAALNPQVMLMDDTPTEKSVAMIDIIRSFVPSNFYSALSNGEYLKISLFAAVLGLGISQVNRNISASFLGLTMDVYFTCRNLVRAITSIVPIVAFCMISATVAHLGIEAVVSMTRFIVAVVGGSLLLCLILVLLCSFMLKISPVAFILAMKDSFMQIVATHSFTESVPNVIDDMTARLKISQQTTNILIPLFGIMLRAGPAFYFGLMVVFIANLYQVPITPIVFIAMLVGAAVAAISSAGSTGEVTVTFGALACSFVGVPFEGILLFLLAADEICSIPRSLLNLAAAATLTTYLSKDKAFANEKEEFFASPVTSQAG